jgi:hypothetical protein
MTDDRDGDPADDIPPTDRESPVGEPVIRGDETVTGDRAADAVAFDPGDPDSVADAAATVREFADDSAASADTLYMLRGAAACAALVRAEESYKAAAERSGASVSFIQKWARVHDLPRPVRRHVALGDIAPTAAKHIARVSGDARYHLAWAALDNDLTVRDVRAIASAVADGTPAPDALRDADVTPGEITVELPLDHYRELRRRAALNDRDPGEVVADALDAYRER